MIRHVAELSAWFLCFVVGIGLVGAFLIGLLWIWGSMSRNTAEAPSTFAELETLWHERPLTEADLVNFIPRRRDDLADHRWLDSEPFHGPHPHGWPTRTQFYDQRKGK